MKKILLIEDDTVLRENTAELLRLSDYEVMTAANGKIGLDLVKKVKPDIIICDIIMPVLDGYSVLEELSKHHDTKFIPFIFLSAKAKTQDIRKGMDLGADDYIAKPFKVDKIISAIESRLAKISILNDKEGLSRDTLYGSKNPSTTISNIKKFFDANGTVFTYSKNEIIYKEGHRSNYIYLVLNGVVRCYKFNENGKVLTTALHKENNLFGYTSFLQNMPYRETAIALKDVEIIGVSKTELKEVLDKNHKITLEFIQLLTDDITGAKDQLLQMAYSSVQKKTASTILRFAEKINLKPEDPIKISRNDLASVAGIATETLIRTMSDFKRQGLIEMEGRNIKVVNLQKLQFTYWNSR